MHNRTYWIFMFLLTVTACQGSLDGVYVTEIYYKGGAFNECVNCPGGPYSVSIAIRTGSDGITTVQLGSSNPVPAQVNTSNGTVYWATIDIDSAGCSISTERHLLIADNQIESGSFVATRQCSDGSSPTCACSYSL